MDLSLFLQITTIASGGLLVVLILLQQRGASLGAGFGASGELFTARRGVEKSIFEVTVIIATIFVLSILAGLLLPS